MLLTAGALLTHAMDYDHDDNNHDGCGVHDGGGAGGGVFVGVGECRGTSRGGDGARGAGILARPTAAAARGAYLGRGPREGRTQRPPGPFPKPSRECTPVVARIESNRIESGKKTEYFR